jgi:adhesin isopeptide-forming family sspB-C2 type protein/fimbrial isopeptide formation D2 family protein
MSFMKKHGMIIGVAASAVVSIALVVVCVVLPAHADGAGSGSGGSGSGSGGSASIHWKYEDAKPATANGVRAFLSSMGYPDAGTAANVTTINTSLSQAVNECNASFIGEGSADCRLVAVGIVGNDDYRKWYESSTWQDRGAWSEAWRAETIGKTYYHNEQPYDVNRMWSDKTGQRNITGMVENNVARDLKASLRVIVLAKNQPQPPKPKTYKMSVSTDQQSPAGLLVGSREPVVDVLHAQASTDVREDVMARWSLHYDGHPDGYVPAKSVVRDVPVRNHGDTRVSFTPADLGFEYWVEGSYWFDVQIGKQAHLEELVDTPDRDPREMFRVSVLAPPAPVKTVQKGTSADRMSNETRIATSTGRGLYELHFVDEIDPHGKAYSVEGMKVVDTSDHDRDISDQFTIAWDKNTNRVSADRDASKGMLPFDHTVDFRFTVVTSKPDFGKITDQAKVSWNHRPSVDTEGKEFPTWRPAPDKSWIKQDPTTGKWAAVIDPDHTNTTGADNHVFLDGDRVASVVNGTVAADLVQAPEKFELKDDWSRASYIFKADDASKVRVYQAEAGSETKSSVSDIANQGVDVTDQFDIVMNGTSVSATAKNSYLAKLKGLDKPLQVTMLVPGVVSFASGKGAEQVRQDFGKAAGDELLFCQAPAPVAGGAAADLTNSGSETMNTHEIATNEPKICGYVPPVNKDVISESSQGGGQESVDGKVVYPGQRVEYQLITEPKLPADLAYGVKSVVFTDQYDQYLKPDKQTVEMMDLNTGRVIAKSKYTTKWDDGKHLFQLTITDAELIGQWRNGGAPRVQIRFEGTVSKNAPTDHKVSNQWLLTINNSLTPSNEVFNLPPEFHPTKQDLSSKDKTISIDGKTLMLGDTGVYRISLDARQGNQAYAVWKLGMVDDFDEEYVSIDPSKIEVIGSDGKDYTKAFNIKIIDGVVYVFAQTVDTPVPATGETVKGDPQPADLKKYAESDKHDPLKDPAIDQGLLGRTYDIDLPFTVIKISDGKVIKNTATQIINDARKHTNTVFNELKPVNPSKDVVVKVNGESVNGKSIYKDSLFLYQLDSSILPANRAYPQATLWTADDQLNPKVDQYTGQWAVYASRDLVKDGKVIATQGEKIAGSGFDSQAFGGDLFTLTYDESGKIHMQATVLYLKLVSASADREVGWRLYIQCKRIAYTERHDNFWVERYNDKELKSNIVWTRTPNLTPKLRIIKFDTKSGLPQGDRNDPKDALNVTGDTDITVRIYNDSATDPDTQRGAVFLGKDLILEDTTIAGDGTVVGWQYPQGWDTYQLKAGKYVDVHGTLKGVSNHHTNRAKVSGKPFLPCPVQVNPEPFAPTGKVESPAQTMKDSTIIDGVSMCGDTRVDSNTDDWNGIHPQSAGFELPETGVNILIMSLLALSLLGGSIAFIPGNLLSFWRRRNRCMCSQ